MLEIRPTCENCNKPLPNGATDAMICTFECTFCEQCVKEILHNVCPNCGGGFTPRPKRPEKLIKKFPPSDKIVHKPVDIEALKKLQEIYEHIPPEKR
ncbi:MAG TPA: DUF1272 domain-containing protein [Flavipsychrobacter sp.]|nr:DUF1272 domain-containing protein [Flavipsychrobacter sp.]